MLAIASTVSFGIRAASAQSGCGAALLSSAPDRLRALEAEHPASAQDAVRRSRELSDLVAGVLAGPPACPGDDDATLVKTLARQHTVVLWAKMIALDVDLPIYRAPYDRACARVDGAAAQLAFVRAFVERLDTEATEASRSALRQALQDDPLAPHVFDLVEQRARRLEIGRLPTPQSDEAGWLARNLRAQSSAAASTPAGARCGPIAGFWGI